MCGFYAYTNIFSCICTLFGILVSFTIDVFTTIYYRYNDGGVVQCSEHGQQEKYHSNSADCEIISQAEEA